MAVLCEKSLHGSLAQVCRCHPYRDLQTVKPNSTRLLHMLAIKNYWRQCTYTPNRQGNTILTSAKYTVAFESIQDLANSKAIRINQRQTSQQRYVGCRICSIQQYLLLFYLAGCENVAIIPVLQRKQSKLQFIPVTDRERRRCYTSEYISPIQSPGSTRECTRDHTLQVESSYMLDGTMVIEERSIEVAAIFYRMFSYHRSRFVGD